MKYRWLLFDADGTLFDYDRAEAMALAATFEQFGYPFNEELLSEYRHINGGLWQDFEKGAISQKKLKTERFKQLCQFLGLELDPSSLSQLYLKNLGQGTFLIDGATETVKKLTNHFKLAIITNGLKDVQNPRIADSSLQKYFPVIIISEEVGAAKPDKKIFDIAFQMMGDPIKEEVLLIGDSLTSDIAGAMNYGIDSCWFNPDRQRRPSGLIIQHEINKLSDLLDLLEIHV
jgi:2-haloacid dehalogenase